MKILIADDQNEKQESLLDFLEDCLEKPTIESSFSFKGTRDKIIKTSYDLVLLDMTMPSFDGKINMEKTIESQKQALAGKDIIQTMNYRNIIIPVIIVTQFDVFGRHNQLTSIEEITTELLNNYPKIVKGFVLWDYQSDSWKKNLLQLIMGIQK